MTNYGKFEDHVVLVDNWILKSSIKKVPFLARCVRANKLINDPKKAKDNLF